MRLGWELMRSGLSAQSRHPWKWLGFSRPQCLYVCLPALLEIPPFQTEHRESWRSGPALPEELRRVVAVYQAVLDLLRQLQVHPEVTSQMLAYLFFFSGTLLFNQLLDKGEWRTGPGPTLLRETLSVTSLGAPRPGQGLGLMPHRRSDPARGVDGLCPPSTGWPRLSR